MNITESLIGKEYSNELILELNQAGYVIRVVHKNGKDFPCHNTGYRAERLNVHLNNKKITLFWFG